MKRSWKKAWVVLAIVLAGLGAAFTVLAARFEPTIRPNTFVGEVAIGGLSPEEARSRISAWWEAAEDRPLAFRSDRLKVLPPSKTPAQLGIDIDDRASIESAPMTSFGGYLSGLFTRGNPAKTQIPVRFKMVGGDFESLRSFVSENAGSPSPARVRYVNGSIVKEPEVSGYALDEEQLPERLMEAMAGEGTVDLPLREGDKRVSDEKLQEISEVVTEFSTKFNAGQANRSSNIKLAASKLDGIILMPGETLSFNNTVGRRTAQAGFRLAGVYANGRHDVDIGGGICQVSTTLYNAALFANLGIKQRSNHSMPVPYVPLGRDATVDYGKIDLMIENTLPGPIAITSEYSPGQLTFRVLGVKDPSLKVEITADGRSSWGTGVRKVTDPSLPAGKTRVIEKGSSGHAINTYRLVYRDGELVDRQPLGQSHYRGAVRVIAVGSKVQAPPAGDVVPDLGSPPATTTPPPPTDPPPSG